VGAFTAKQLLHGIPVGATRLGLTWTSAPMNPKDNWQPIAFGMRFKAQSWRTQTVDLTWFCGVREHIMRVVAAIMARLGHLFAGSNCDLAGYREPCDEQNRQAKPVPNKIIAPMARRNWWRILEYVLQGLGTESPPLATSQQVPGLESRRYTTCAIVTPHSRKWCLYSLDLWVSRIESQATNKTPRQWENTDAATQKKGGFLGTPTVTQPSTIFKYAPPPDALIQIDGVVCAIPGSERVEVVKMLANYSNEVEQARDEFVKSAQALNGSDSNRDAYEESFTTLQRAILNSWRAQQDAIKQFRVSAVRGGVAFYSN
jgi:hypothetical protein